MKKIKSLVAYLTKNEAIENVKIQSINGISSLLMYAYLRIDFDVALIKEIIIVDVYFVLLNILVNFGFEVKGLEYINQKAGVTRKKRIATTITVIRLLLLLPGLFLLLILINKAISYLIILFLLKILAFIFINAYYYLSVDKLNVVANKYLLSFIVPVIITLFVIYQTKNINYLAFYYSGMFVMSMYLFIVHIYTCISLKSIYFYFKKNLRFFPIYTSSVFIKELNIPLMNLIGVSAAKIELYNIIDKMIRILVSGIRPMNQILLKNYHKFKVVNLSKYLLSNLKIHFIAHSLFTILLFVLYAIDFINQMEIVYIICCSILIYFSLYNYLKISISSTTLQTTGTIVTSGITGLMIIYFLSSQTYVFIILAYLVPEITLSLLLNQGSRWSN